MALNRLDDLLAQQPSTGLRALVRVDYNVPMKQGRVTDDARILRTLPTIKRLQKHGCKVILISHFGRPKGVYEPGLSLAPVADALQDILGEKVHFGVDCVGAAAEAAVEKCAPGEVLLLENLRFHDGERQNDPAFVDGLAALADMYVNDAFSCSHRAHASITGVASRLPSAAGLLLEEEIRHLEQALSAPERPVMAVVGGAKVSTKIAVLKNLVEQVDYLVVGGGMANTFLAASGCSVGASLCEQDFLETAREIAVAAEQSGCQLLLPEDVVVAEKFEAHAANHVVAAGNVPEDKMILDIGPCTMLGWSEALQQCKTLVWNGPLGVFELSPFDAATLHFARMVARQSGEGKLVSVAGGGDVVAAINHAGVADQISYISTAGGAFMEWLEGQDLPGVAVLSKADAKAA